MKWWIPFLPAFAFATVNEPIRWELLTGYRNDRVHWHLQSPGESGALHYSERYTDVNFWQNDLALRVIHRDLAFYVQGGYSAFGKGDLLQRLANLSYATDQPHLKYNTNGWAADGTGYFGYAVNLTAGRTYKVMLIPFLGASLHYEKVGGAGTSHWSSDNAVGATSYTLDNRFPKKLDHQWYGFLLGAGFRVEPGGRLTFDCGYAYNWLHLYFKSQFQETLSLFDGSDLLSETTTLNKVKAKEWGNLGHTGWIDLEYIVNRDWKVGLASQIRYYVSRVLTVTQSQTITQTFPTTVETEAEFPQKLKLRWTPISVLFTISRNF